MNVAMILAGGVESRMGANVPKQYFLVQGKPIIAYTLKKFEKSEYIDAIEVVCAAEWSEFIETLAQKYGISKLKWVANGGPTCQASIRNGIFALHGKISEADILFMHNP